MALVMPSFWRKTLLVVLFQCTLCAHVNIQIFMIDRGAIHHEIYFIPVDEPTDVASIGMHIWHLINNTFCVKVSKEFIQLFATALLLQLHQLKTRVAPTLEIFSNPMESNSFTSLSDLTSRTSDLTLSLYASSIGTRLHCRFFHIPYVYLADLAWQQKQLTCIPRNDLNLAILRLHFNESEVQHALHHMVPLDPFGDCCHTLNQR